MEFIYYLFCGIVIFGLYSYYILNPQFVRNTYEMTDNNDPEKIYLYYYELYNSNIGQLLGGARILAVVWKIIGLFFTFQYSIFMVTMLITILLTTVEKIITNGHRENLKDWQISVRYIIELCMLTFIVKNGLEYHITLF